MFRAISGVTVLAFTVRELISTWRRRASPETTSQLVADQRSLPQDMWPPTTFPQTIRATGTHPLNRPLPTMQKADPSMVMTNQHPRCPVPVMIPDMSTLTGEAIGVSMFSSRALFECNRKLSQQHIPSSQHTITVPKLFQPSKRTMIRAQSEQGSP